VTPVPQFLVSGRSEIGGYWSFVRWLGRQFFFVKVYQRSRWHLLWAKCALDIGAIWLTAYQASHRIVRGEWPVSAEAAVVTLAASAAALGTFHVLRYFLPVPPPRRAWLGATLLAHGVGLLACADATLRRKRLTWSDLTYELGPDGRVAHVTDSSAPRAAPAVDDPVAEEAVA
jgi:hypothetical protein